MNARAAGRERHAVPMAELTTWRCGGAADTVYAPADVDDLCAYLARLPAAAPVLWLGRGSNVLARDGGVRGVVIRLQERFARIGIEPPRADAQGGAPCARLAAETAAAGLGGLEFLAGVPGTVGGALAMNAGAAGGETWETVESIETVDRRGRRHVFRAADIDAGYRAVALPAGHGVIAGRFRLRADPDPAAPRRRIREQMERRRRTQPLAQPNSGSVFRNPPDGHAAALIEASGLKGCRMGGAEVSRRHANFIVTEPGARARDVENLIEHVRGVVERDSGVRLELEVRILGEAA